MKRDSRYRFLINDNPYRLEVHDLTNEKTGANQCQIDEIANYRHLISFKIEDLIAWLKSHPKYDGCKYCLTKYHWK